MTLINPGDTILGLDLAHGGHLTHGHKLNFSGKLYRIVGYQVRKDTETVDYDELAALAERDGPRVLLGDLNLGPEVVVPAVTAAGYTVAPTEATFPACAPRTRIDFVAVSGLDVVQASTPEVGTSDHLPVVAEVRSP